ncbi:MAG: hypothetical protein LBK58_15575 [Prevotellaceae bacterium]|nr:hypothetical protein [Prevotellaceae bacterium]
MLKSYDFWDLADKAGYGEEIYGYGTKENNRLDSVINMNNWFDDYSGYIVYKYLNLLKSIKIDLIENSGRTFFIFPDERQKNATPSNRLAESLKYFFKAKSVGIPLDEKREAIGEDWKKAIKHLHSYQYDYVIIDEFHRDGTTFESMMKILGELDISPKCFFPIINFNPQKTKEYEKQYEGLHVLSLYEFNIK